MSTLLLTSRIAIIHHWTRGLCTANEANRLLAESAKEAKALRAEADRLEMAALRGLEGPLSDLEMQHEIAAGMQRRPYSQRVLDVAALDDSPFVYGLSQ